MHRTSKYVHFVVNKARDVFASRSYLKRLSGYVHMVLISTNFRLFVFVMGKSVCLNVLLISHASR